ncbi:MAG TPA: PQQ-binding-like beta-propeller repeat protein [Gemmataceae bacterium]|jgi:outer membrane protein assembly factor BamB|nr:PQQ-binding-like beta-propeller repeat protein [Gemmataceae bacterium]
MMLRVAATATLLSVASIAHSGDWPAWRGPDGMGQCPESKLPLRWSDTENVRWKVALPDRGNSTPVIWRDRIFLTQGTDKGRKRSTLCLDRRDGHTLWERTVEYTKREPTHETNYYCSASAATDGERVVVSHGSAGVWCYDFDGRELWHRDLGECQHIWGNAASPVLFQDLVFLNFGPGERTFLIALDKKTGQDVWKADEPGGRSGDKGQSEWLGSWSTPVVARINGRDELVMTWPGVVKSYNPRTGDLFWQCSGLAKDKAPDRLVYTSPLVTSDVVVAMAGFGGPAIAVKTGGSGDVTGTHRLWRHPTAPQRIGSGVIVGDHVYIVDEPGTMRCIECQTGNLLWDQRLTSSTWGSLVHAGERLYITNRDGETFVLAAKPKFEVLSRNPLKETTQASVAVSDGEIFIRTFKHLWCIREGATPR